MKRTAIIDIGSNSVRLVLYEGQKEIENIKVFAQLRRHLDASGNISGEGIENLLETLDEFSKMIKFYEVKNVLCGATATVRQAKNKAEIQKLVREQTGLKMKIISEYEEAFYGCQAIINSTPITNGYTIDLGGGSTEVTLVLDRKLAHYHSFPFGAVSLKQQFVAGNTPTPEELENISAYIQQQFRTLPWIEANHYPIYAIGGSARNLARAHQNLIGYPLLGEHLYQMKLEDLTHVQEQFNDLGFELLSHTVGVHKDRADTIIPAVQTFIELAELTKTQGFYLSRKGFRDGLVAPDHEMLDLKAIRKNSVAAIVGPSPLYKVAKQLYKQLKIGDGEDEFLEYAMALYNVGTRISKVDSRAHSFYFIANQPMNGFTHKDRVMLALLASYHSRGKYKKDIEPFAFWFTKEERQRIQVLGAVIKFVNAMTLKGSPIISKFKIAEQSRNHLNLQVVMTLDFPHIKEEIVKQKKHLERALRKDIHLEFGVK